MNKDTSITFRIPAELKAAAERAAEADCRSVGQLCTFLLTKHLEAVGEWPPARKRAPGPRARTDRR
ncbi:MAG: hypothetical protein H6708_27710 [Kofleriaceae bacterium]|nr:hypothetical protein [Myxococcales bacterium]MCB9564195.1 hypothetical protein [Kofleriaceae bacterium]